MPAMQSAYCERAALPVRQMHRSGLAASRRGGRTHPSHHRDSDRARGVALMPRGAKVDRAVTKLLGENGLLLDKRSFVSLDGHLYLRGLDKISQRPRVFKLHKEKCAVCGALASEHGGGEWHHLRRCDCVGCSEVRCSQFVRDCHRHRTPGFQRVAKGTE